MKAKRNDGLAETLTPEQLEAAVAMYLAANPDATTQTDDDDVQDPVEKIRQNVDRRDEDIESVSPEEIPDMQQEIKTLLGVIDEMKGSDDMNTDDDDVNDDPDKTDDDDDPTNTDDDDDPEKQDPTNTDDDDTQAPAEDKTMNMDSVERNFGEMYSIVQMASKLGLTGYIPHSVMDGKKKIIQTINPKLKLDGKSKAYINGAYTAAVQLASARKSAVAKTKALAGNGSRRHADGYGMSGAEAARQKMIKRQLNNGKETN